MKETFVSKNFKENTLKTITQANEIITEYKAAGYSLTLRQLYYQFVARGMIENSQRSYKNLGSVVNDGRLAGLIPWDSIEDRTRNLVKQATWDSPAEIITACAEQFTIDKWKDQNNYCEVWIEKEALVGVIEPVCRRWNVPYFACRGYTSQSEQWRAGKRLARQFSKGKDIYILHLGDHDPSGMDMTRDNADRLSMFADERVEVRRLALNMDQVNEFNPPPNPAKFTDSRCEGYVRNFGDQSWELDALQPAFIESLIDENITGLLDMDTWDESVETEEIMKEQIKEAGKNLK